ncbi:MAG: B12-binding domain-containing radical SAM protein [Chloroflexi bacterium]|nr:B12-binding domain-containing radical SAM protein [Chloroflexota bacterium]
MAKERRKDRPLAHRALASFYIEKRRSEIGQLPRAWGADLPVAICYPNSYAIGMNNLGLFALLQIINQHDGFIAERVFFEERFVEEALSVESNRPLSDYAHLVFTISYELDFFNVAALLKRSNIPLYAKDRQENDPVVLCGGAAVCANFAPVAPFFDAICIGEAEAILPNVLNILKSSLNRQEKLRQLSTADGVYVPNLSKNTQRAYVKELINPPYTAIINKETQSGGAFMMEISRSCPYTCNFCVAKSAFAPFRHYPLENLLQTLKKRPNNTKVWLVGAASFAHPQIDELTDYMVQENIPFAISSLRAKPLSLKLLQNLRKGGNKSLSLAPESSQSLRKNIGKDIDDQYFIEACQKASALGFNEIKLYFMVGLPQETRQDLEEIVNLSIACAKMGKPARLSISVASFIAKITTPMQNSPLTSISELKKKINFLQKALPKEGIRVKAESPHESIVQALLSRAGSDIAPVIAAAQNSSLSSIKQVLI